LARPEAVRLHLRPRRFRDGGLHPSEGFVTLHALHAGLRRTRGLPHGPGHPERVQALIVQNAVAHNEGLGATWKPRRAFWADRAGNETTFRTNFLSIATTRTRHVEDDSNLDRYDPDLWTDEFAFLSKPGQPDIQTELFYDYRTNVDAYPKWQAWMREKQPCLLVIWGKHDLSFDPGEPERYHKDVPNAEIHVLDAGHFAIDTKTDEMQRCWVSS
jgi:pimeloyl-ACP methyl ester carboxylesterase